MEKRGVGAAGVGPRVIGRLTPELISRSPQYMSCINQYELDLRGCRIATIENLGATEVSRFCTGRRNVIKIQVLRRFPYSAASCRLTTASKN
jgi:Leucine-rich repeat